MRVRRVEVGKLHSLTRFSHHFCNCIPPRLVVLRLFVRPRCLLVEISFDEQEPAGIICLLKKVEPDNTRFLSTGFGVSYRSLLESLNKVWLHSYVDVNN